MESAAKSALGGGNKLRWQPDWFFWRLAALLLSRRSTRDILLRRALPAAKIPASSCRLNLLTPPYLKHLALSSDFKKLKKEELRRRLAKEIGSNSNYVARLLAGLAVYEAIEGSQFFDIAGLDEKTISYSVLTTALMYDTLSKYIGLKGPTDDEVSGLPRKELKELTIWLFEKNSEGQTRLGESRNLQKLARVVAEPKALEKFRMAGRWPKPTC